MHVQGSYRALKLRVGDTPLRDIHRVRAVQEALGEGVEIMVDGKYRLLPRGCMQGHASIRRLRRFLVGGAFSCTRLS
ncbi:MAG: enolase C-terminal domain-like protein [Alphaproteobacteria bacterium]